MIAETQRLLTAAEEVALARRVQDGKSGEGLTADAVEARNELVARNTRLARKICREYSGRGMSHEDLYQEACLGLIRGATDYDPAFGARFSTYASYWIKERIQKSLTNGGFIRLPAHMFLAAMKWRRAEKALAGRGPDEVASHLGWSPEQAKTVQQAIATSRVHSLALSDDRHSVPPDETLMEREIFDDVLKTINACKETHRQVMILRFGLDGSEPRTLKEVSVNMGCTREWVRKMELRTLENLRKVYA